MTQTVLQPSRPKTPLGTRLQSPLRVLGRSLLTGLGYVLVTIIAGIIAGATGLPVPPIAAQIDQGQLLLLTFLSGVLIGLTLGPLAARLSLPAGQRIVVLFVLVFLVQNLLSNIEALFFTTYIGGGLAFIILSGALSAAGLAIVLALLFRPVAADRRLDLTLRETLAQRPRVNWAWRFVLAGLLYVPIYYFFGSLIAPTVLPYYNNPALGTGLVVPGLEVLLPLEAVRGLLFVLAVLPLVAVLRGSRRSLAFWIGLSFAVLASWTPMLLATWLPLTLRAVHGLEITADSFIHAALIAWLLASPQSEKPG